MNYTLTSDSGNITIPELQNIDYKGLKLIGRNTPNWNEPIQQNFIKLADMIGNETDESKLNIIQSEMPGYSTEEVLTTERWIDGKPIYRKVMLWEDSDGMVEAERYFCDLVHPDLGDLVHLEHKFVNKLNNYEMIDTGYLTTWVGFYEGKPGFSAAMTHADYTKVQFIVKYTKTTDTAESPVAQLSIAGKETVVGSGDLVVKSSPILQVISRNVPGNIIRSDTDSDSQLIAEINLVRKSSTSNIIINYNGNVYNNRDDTTDRGMKFTTIIKFNDIKIDTSETYIADVLSHLNRSNISGSVTYKSKEQNNIKLELFDGTSSLVNVETSSFNYTIMEVETDESKLDNNINIIQSEMPAYSEEEVLTTERWIDGKPIYRKSFSLIAPDVTHEWADTSIIVDSDLEAICTYDYFMNSGLKSHSFEDISKIAVRDDLHIWLLITEDWQKGQTLTYNVSYTKTTDTAESPVAQLSIPEYTDVYSTEETLTNKVWMGKAVYRKVLTGITDDDANDIEFNPDIGEVENCKVIDFSVLDSNGFNNTGTNSLYTGDGGECRSNCKNDGSLVRLKISEGNDTQKNAPYTITIEYTKA